MFLSMEFPMKWTKCGNPWNTDRCFTLENLEKCQREGGKLIDGHCSYRFQDTLQGYSELDSCLKGNVSVCPSVQLDFKITDNMIGKELLCNGSVYVCSVPNYWKYFNKCKSTWEVLTQEITEKLSQVILQCCCRM